MKFTNRFSIAGINTEINTTFPVGITEGFQPFYEEAGSAEITVRFTGVDELEFNTDEPWYSNMFFSVYKDETGFYKVFHNYLENNRLYAVSRIMSNNCEEIRYLKECESILADSRSCFMHISFDGLLLRQGAVILHASFIDTVYGGILFSAPSGTGKSTQAELWERFRGAKTINGDRTILKKDENHWKAYGSPYAGSSEYYVNESRKVAAIIILSQSKENKIVRMGQIQAFHKLYSEMVVNAWDSKCVEAIASYVEQLVKEVPVYMFSCTPDESAVEFLDKAIKRELHCEK